MEPLVTLETEALLRRARKEPLSSHGLFARSVLSMPRVSDEVPWPLKDLYKILHSGALVWFNAQTCVWTDADPKTGSLALGEYITAMLQRALVKYRIECRDQIGVGAQVELDEFRWDVANQQFRNGVASCIMGNIIESEGFHLDPDSSRRYLNFGSKCYDRDTDSWVDTRPDFYISRCTEWE